MRGCRGKVRFTRLHEPEPVLLAGNDQYSILAAVRALRAADYAPWLAVSQPGTYAAHSRATVGTVLVPNAAIDSEGFVRKLAATARQLSAVAVLPGEDSHFLALTGREVDFPGIAFGVPSRESVEQVMKKDLLPKLAAAAKLRTPPTAKVVCGDSETLSMFGFPAIVKPLRSWTWNRDGTMSAQRASYASSKEQAEEALKNFPGAEGLVQPYIPGPNVSISGVSWEGKLVCAVHHISERIWPATSGVTAYAKTIPPNGELEQGVGGLLQATGWSGLFETEFKRSPHGEHYLIDLNPRVYGSLALAVAAGLNLPGIWVDLVLGRRASVDDSYRVGVRFRQEEKDARALARMLTDGELWYVLQGLMPRRGTTHAIFSLRDPMPLFTSARKLAKWLRCYDKPR
ncbi:MAG: ATP-grasp domain-containing protein [Actinomycetota bacterium]|nr:ATP-grasp domain-containing protein [Actinomycetota bacterium]